MELSQIAKTVEWLDAERRKDKQELTVLSERIGAMAAENSTLMRRIHQLETDLAASNNQVARLSKIDEILDGYRKELTRQVSEVEKRSLEANKEDERLRRIDRDGVNKSIAEVRKELEGIARLERDLQARREEEQRAARAISELQKRVEDFNKLVDDRNRAVTLVEEGRRQDAKRLTDVQTEHADLRRRTDDVRGKIEIVEDIARRAEVRITEVVNAESERRALQTQWTEAQTIRQTEHERAWVELQGKVEGSLSTMEEYARRVNAYYESNRELARAAQEMKQATELLERRLNEAGEIQRLSEDRIRQDWAAFLADDQKRWTTHMLLRDEQWREHDRLEEKQTSQIENLDEALVELRDSLARFQETDNQRMALIVNLARELAADAEPVPTPKTR
jgi:chromosome segregation ATPase